MIIYDGFTLFLGVLRWILPLFLGLLPLLQIFCMSFGPYNLFFQWFMVLYTRHILITIGFGSRLHIKCIFGDDYCLLFTTTFGFAHVYLFKSSSGFASDCLLKSVFGSVGTPHDDLGPIS